jgi:TfdA family taurine catabolism dioxygenase TauD
LAERLKSISDPAAWYGPDMAKRPESWIYELTSAEAEVLVETAIDLDRRGLDLMDITPDTVSESLLSPALNRLRREILFGRGFALIRGLPIDQLSYRQAAIAFWVVGMGLGDEALPQNAKGHTLGHVRDLGFDYSKPTARGYQTSARLPYHCDAGDIVGLLSLNTPKSGGLSTIAPSVTIYNEMVKRRPDLAAVLTKPLYRDRRDEIPAGKHEWYALPAFNFRDDQVFTVYVRSGIRKAQRFADVPRLTSAQEEAMDLFDGIAEDEAVHLDMEFQPGDMQFLCNHWILHSRTAFEDWEDPECKRHLLRLWLACNDGPPVPDVIFNYQIRTAGNRPGGIIAPDGLRHAPLDIEDGGAGQSTLRQAETAGMQS